jgi:hypothetical protein
VPECPFWLEVRYVPNGVSKEDVPKVIRDLLGLSRSDVPNSQFKATDRAGTQGHGKRVSVYFRTEELKDSAKDHFLSVNERRWPDSGDHPALKLCDENSSDLRNRQ